MSENKGCCCQNPEMLKGKPEDCTPEVIKKCHGEEVKHSCESDAGNEQTAENKEESKG